MTGQIMDGEVVAHVLWHADAGGYPPGGFITALLDAWTKADPMNSARLGRAFPGYAQALDILALPGGIDRLRRIHAEESRP